MNNWNNATTVITYILIRLTRNVDERLVVCSSWNVVVQVLVQSTATAMEEDNIKYPYCETASLCAHPSLDVAINNPGLL